MISRPARPQGAAALMDFPLLLDGMLFVFQAYIFSLSTLTDPVLKATGLGTPDFVKLQGVLPSVTVNAPPTPTSGSSPT